MLWGRQGAGPTLGQGTRCTKFFLLETLLPILNRQLPLWELTTNFLKHLSAQTPLKAQGSLLTN